MPLQKLVLTIGRTDADDVQWSFGADGATATNAKLGLLAGRWSADFTAEFPASQPFSLGMQMESLASYPPVAGPAIAYHLFNPPFVIGGGVAANQDVAVAVSRDVQTVRGIKPKGRVYLGPFNSGQVNSVRPAESLLTSLRSLMRRWHLSMVAEGLTPVVIHAFENKVAIAPVGWPILSYSTDNEWDTQRRRGLDPTTRTTTVV